MDCPNCGYKLEDGMKTCLQCGFDLRKKVFRPDRFAPILLRAAALCIDGMLVGGAAAAAVLLANLPWPRGLLGSVAAYLVYVLYGTIFESLRHLRATPGKALLGICVVRVNGSPLSLTYAFLRNLTKILSVLTLVGVVMAFLNDGRQALHDLFGRDFVIMRKDY